MSIKTSIYHHKNKTLPCLSFGKEDAMPHLHTKTRFAKLTVKQVDLIGDIRAQTHCKLNC
jgi:hypothetical protein